MHHGFTPPYQAYQSMGLGFAQIPPSRERVIQDAISELTAERVRLRAKYPLIFGPPPNLSSYQGVSQEDLRQYRAVSQEEVDRVNREDAEMGKEIRRLKLELADAGEQRQGSGGSDKDRFVEIAKLAQEIGRICQGA